MGKVPTTASAAAGAMNQRKKKKGRPLKNPVPIPPKSINYDSTPPSNRRSTRRNPSNFNSPPQPEFDDDDDDDDERKEKKVKLVVRLPESGDTIRVNHRRSMENESESDSDPESEDRDAYAKKRKINAVDRGSEDADDDTVQEQEIVKTADAPLHGSPLESGPTTPLPDKKILMFILERLQKKDTYGVFSEPVDPNELPDYFEIIEQPMDFGTVKKKIDGGAYKNVEELEVDVLLICSNAMQYNDPDTVYYRQARSIEVLAKRDFQNLKHEGDNGEPQPKVVRRGRPPSIKNLKKSLEASPVDFVGPEPSSVPTPASVEDKATGSNSYNLRKPHTLYRYRSTDPYGSSYHSRNGENYSEWLADWNDEFPASILRADMKYGKKHFTVDEGRRDTFKQFLPVSSGSHSTELSSGIGDVKRLVPVGLQEPLTYARSLARYAANLGPIAWKIASKKIESAIPAGVQYGPGWVGDNGIASQFSFSTEKEKSSNSTAGDCNSSKLLTPSTSDLSSAIAHGPTEAMVEAVRKLNSQNEQGDASSWKTPFPSQQKPIYPSHRNGYNPMIGFDLSGVLAPSQMVEEAKSQENWSNLSHGNPISQGKISTPHGESDMWNFGKSGWQGLAMQQRHSVSVPPDLNVRVPAGSPSSSGLQIGSPQQPDLALQL